MCRSTSIVAAINACRSTHAGCRKTSLVLLDLYLPEYGLVLSLPLLHRFSPSLYAFLSSIHAPRIAKIMQTNKKRKKKRKKDSLIDGESVADQSQTEQTQQHTKKIQTKKQKRIQDSDGETDTKKSSEDITAVAEQPIRTQTKKKKKKKRKKDSLIDGESVADQSQTEQTQQHTKKKQTKKQKRIQDSDGETDAKKASEEITTAVEQSSGKNKKKKKKQKKKLENQEIIPQDETVGVVEKVTESKAETDGSTYKPGDLLLMMNPEASLPTDILAARDGEPEQKHETDSEESEDSQYGESEQDSGKKSERDLEDPEARNMRTVFVGNVPLSLKKTALREHFIACGAIESIRLRSVAFDNPKLSRKAAMAKKAFHEQRDSCNAYIVFKEEKSVEDALLLNGLYPSYYFEPSFTPQPSTPTTKLSTSQSNFHSQRKGNLIVL